MSTEGDAVGGRRKGRWCEGGGGDGEREGEGDAGEESEMVWGRREGWCVVIGRGIV